MKSMNTFVAIAAASFLLSACGSDSSPAKIAEEHEHALLISQANTDYLSVLEEGEAESLAESALGNAAELLLADNGELAAAYCFMKMKLTVY